MEDHGGAEETNKKEEAAEEKSGKQRAAEANCYALTTPASPITSLKGLSVTCSDSNQGGERFGVNICWGGKVFFLSVLMFASFYFVSVSQYLHQ